MEELSSHPVPEDHRPIAWHAGSISTVSMAEVQSDVVVAVVKIVVTYFVYYFVGCEVILSVKVIIVPSKIFFGEFRLFSIWKTEIRAGLVFMNMI